MIPSVSIVIPVYNGAADLRLCLASLSQSSSQPLECIVIDDGSTDDSNVAAEFGATVLSTNAQGGPARARNMGAGTAKGDVLLFLDSDVCVHPDTLFKIATGFANDPAMDALMGAYDDSPSAPNYISQYRNLMHHFVHRNSKEQTNSFWAGCGAIRREVFLEFGGFDEKFRSPAIEDIELGYRLARANRKLVLNANLQVKHVKRWSMRNMLRTDFFYRALPWSELSLSSGKMPNDLNLRISQRISVALVFLISCLGAYLAVHWHAYFLTPLFATFFILLSQYWLETSEGHHPLIMTLMAIVIGLIILFSYLLKMYAIIPTIILAWAALLTRHRYTHARNVWHRWTGMLVGGYCLLALGFVWIYLPWNPLGCTFLLALLTLVALNKHFYLFLAGERGKLFALAAIPFHLLFFFSAGLAFGMALVRHYFGKLTVGVPVEAAEAEIKR